MSRVSSFVMALLLFMLVGCQTVDTRTKTAIEGDEASGVNVVMYSEEIEPTARTIVISEESKRVALHSAASQSPVLSPPSTTSLTLADLERLAVHNNPTLASAASRIDSAKAQRFQSRRYPNPVVGYHATEIGNLGTAGQQGAFVSQRFITGGKLQLDQDIAGKVVDETHFLYLAQQQRVMNDVRIRFYDTLVSQHHVFLIQQLVDVANEIEEAIQKLLQNKIGTESGLLQAQIEAEQSTILLDNSRNAHRESWQRLYAVVGLSNQEAPVLQGSLESDVPVINRESCLASVLGSNPEIHAANARVEKSRIAIRRARTEPLPNIDISVSARHHNVTGSEVANVQVGVPLPLFDKNEGNILAAEAEHRAAYSEMARLRLKLQDRLAVVWRQYSNASHQVERYSSKIVPQAERALKLTQNGYDQGRGQYLDVLAAKQKLVELKLSHLNSLRELWIAATILDGNLLSENLAEAY